MKRTVRIVWNICITVLAAAIIALALYRFQGINSSGPLVPVQSPAAGTEEHFSPNSSVLSGPEISSFSSSSNPSPDDEPSPSPVPTPEPDPSQEQLQLLEELLTAFQESNASKAGAALHQWYQLWEDTGEDWVDITGNAYDGTQFYQDYTGTALATDKTSRFYYGPLENGVPQGDGLRIAFVDSEPLRYSYFWTEGHWENGVMTGDVRFYLESVQNGSESDYSTYFELVGTLDGTSEEIVAEGTATNQFVSQNMDHSQYVSRHTFHVADGSLVAEEWSPAERSNGYSVYSHDVLHPEVTTSINVYSLDEPFFKNPYPWEGEYVFAYQQMFRCSFIW